MEGASPFTDDCLLIEVDGKNVSGITNYPGLRLANDSAWSILNKNDLFSNKDVFPKKIRFFPDGCKTADWPTEMNIDAIFLLNNPNRPVSAGEISIQPVRKTGELLSLIKQTFALDSTDKTLIVKRFAAVVDLINSHTSIFHLEYPRSHSLLPVLYKKIVKLTG